MALLDTTFTNTSNITTITNSLTTTIDSGQINITTDIIPDRYQTFAREFITNFNNEQNFKSKGWFNISRNITKYLKNGLARCLQCYNTKRFNQITYVRILNVIAIDNAFNNADTFDRVICICNDCVMQINQSNGTVKSAPRNYHDVLLDYLIHEQFDLLLTDIGNVQKSDTGSSLNLTKLQEKIDYMRFNINEKTVLLNNLTNENEKLSKNLDIEIEKHKLFFDHKNKNNELIKRFRKQFNDLSIELFRENKKILEDYISKYQELNQTSKYSIPECRICMQNEVKIAIQCGHLLCHVCYSKLQNDKKQDNINNNNESDADNADDSICCPLCRTYCNTYTQIYF